MQRLKGKVAVVTGASRSAGRGIALVLGEQGATVYVTGRSVRSASTTGLPGATIEDTAEMVMDRGGVGIPVRCDHTVDEQVEALFAQIKQEEGRIDLLINNVFGAELGVTNAPFWQLVPEHWQGMFMAGVRAHLMASSLAVPLMLPQQQGLIVNTSENIQSKYHGHLYYDLAHIAINRMVFGMAHELRKYKIAAVALVPGWLRNEGILHGYNTDEQNWHKIPGLRRTESPQYIGRAVAALASDPHIMKKSGKLLLVGDLALEYGFTDIDGRQPRFYDSSWKP